MRIPGVKTKVTSREQLRSSFTFLVQGFTLLFKDENAFFQECCKNSVMPLFQALSGKHSPQYPYML
ncbi:hypothetical protein SAMN04488128_1021209 [Chitinophaga eiseniae]|uniref:Uncharacterized protein n=1 Tax=Chitinophaga eiseniae TaxID=634771 RepID=A0A1T4RJ60_9BACT|nr:hypothetical protein SAMN04488128_1021209 [Chitinophaga eiseniae]